MTFIALRCHRCGAYGQSEGLDVFDAEHQAEAAGWVTHAIGYSEGRVAVIDCCPQCLAARTGAVRESRSFNPYPEASKGQPRTTSSELCSARGASRANAPELATPHLIMSSPANPDPQGAPAPDAAGGSRTIESPTMQANHTYLSAAPGSDARDLSRRM
jgi:hypothetical protein